MSLSLAEAQLQQDLFSSDIRYIPIQNIATDIISHGPMETRACMSMVANTNSLTVRVCATLVSPFPYLYLVSCSCLSTARNQPQAPLLFALLNTPALSSCCSPHRDKIPPLVKIHGAVSLSSCKSLLKTRCCLNACKS